MVANRYLFGVERGMGTPVRLSGDARRSGHDKPAIGRPPSRRSGSLGAAHLDERVWQPIQGGNFYPAPSLVGCSGCGCRGGMSGVGWVRLGCKERRVGLCHFF